MAILTGTLLAFGIAAPAYASYTYINYTKIAEGVTAYSGYRSVVNGGYSQLYLGVGTHTLVTYKPAPGYRVIQETTTVATKTNDVYHTPVNDAHSKCYWWAGGVGGSTEMTCRVDP